MIANRPISEASAKAPTNSQRGTGQPFQLFKKVVFAERTQFRIENKRALTGFTQTSPVLSAQRSVVPERQTVVSGRTDKYRVRCVLSAFIRFHPSPALASPGATQ